MHYTTKTIHPVACALHTLCISHFAQISHFEQVSYYPLPEQSFIDFPVYHYYHSIYEQELNFEGYEAITAANGKQALDKVQWQHPDIIIMEINMPKMDGLEAIGKIIGKYKRAPIIIHTAYSNYKDNFMSWAADGYVVKSSDLTELKTTINDLLTKKSVAVPMRI